VDEVLAVGDAAFQKKCLGKMGEVAKEGRTVLFVSHNMGAIRAFCKRAVLLEQGKVLLDGDTSQVISTYMSIAFPEGDETNGEIFWTADHAPGTHEICLRGIQLIGPSGIVQSTFEAEKPIQVAIYYEVKRPLRGFRFNLYILTQEGEVAFLATDHMFRSEIEGPGIYKSVCTIWGGLLNRRRYVVAVDCDIPGVKVLIPRREFLSFTVTGGGNQASIFPEEWPGVVCPRLEWQIEKVPGVP
jgi:lipopolysaccharide transport system ATP-binding protein